MKRILTLFLAVVLLLTAPMALASCGKNKDIYDDCCSYFETRSTEGRDIKYVKMKVKNYGTIVLLLDATTAPITVENFLKLVNEGFYNGLTFHRVMSNFMIQGGDPKANGTGGSDQEIKGEFLYNGWMNDISHLEGVISMARSNDYDSASSQFFICNADAKSSLDYKYAAFGYVISGMSVVHSITNGTVGYANSESGTIAKKSKQAVIRSVKEITEEQAMKLVNK